jgi:hypothetical protein
VGHLLDQPFESTLFLLYPLDARQEGLAGTGLAVV